MYKKLLFSGFITGAVIIFSQNLYAQVNNSQALPFNCLQNQYRVQGQQLILNTNKNNQTTAQLYVFHNISQQDIWLDHPIAHPGASAGWASPMKSNHWTALALDKPNFKLSCNQMQKDGGSKRISCNKVLWVCAVKNAHFQDTQGGSYWVSENQVNSNTLVTRIKQRDIIWTESP